MIRRDASPRPMAFVQASAIGRQKTAMPAIWPRGLWLTRSGTPQNGLSLDGSSGAAPRDDAGVGEMGAFRALIGPAPWGVRSATASGLRILLSVGYAPPFRSFEGCWPSPQSCHSLQSEPIPVEGGKWAFAAGASSARMSVVRRQVIVRSGLSAGLRRPPRYAPSGRQRPF